jgi:hypothetical protein
LRRISCFLCRHFQALEPIRGAILTSFFRQSEFGDFRHLNLYQFQGRRGEFARENTTLTPMTGTTVGLVRVRSECRGTSPNSDEAERRALVRPGYQ